MRGEGPVAEAESRQNHTDDARCQCRRHTAFGYLLDLHLLGQISRLRHAKAREDEPQEHVAAQGDELRLVVIVGNQRSTEPQHHVDGCSSKDIKPEDSVVVVVGGCFQIDQSRLETARLQFVGNHRKDGEHRRHSVIRRIEQSSEDNAKG